MVEAVSTAHLGIKIPDGWINYDNSGSLESMKVELGKLRKGCVIRPKYSSPGMFSEFVLVSEPERKVVTYEDLLGRMKEIFPGWSLEVLRFEYDLERKFAFAHIRVCVMSDNGVRCMEEVGDASPESLSSNFIMPHFIRMALTRAKSRAFKNLLGEAEVSEEETVVKNGRGCL